jgi:flagellar biosynthesis anti-sigma factor FlgM
METRRDLAVQKTQASEVGAEERKAHHLKHGYKSGSHTRKQVAPQEQLHVQHALKSIQRSPEVRAEKINALRTQIEAGTYQINSTSLARKLLGINEQDAS